MARPTGISKTENEYQQLLTTDFYSSCPKAVLAALAVSFAVRNGISLSEVEEALREEWRALYDAGIIPQKVIKG